MRHATEMEKAMHQRAKRYTPPTPCPHCGRPVNDASQDYCDADCRNAHVVEMCTLWPEIPFTVGVA